MIETNNSFPIPKGKKIYIALEATEDTDFFESEMLSKIYAGKIVIDKFDCRAIQLKGTLEETVKKDVLSKLTQYLLNEGLLDCDLLNDMAYNGGGIK